MRVALPFNFGFQCVPDELIPPGGSTGPSGQPMVSKASIVDGALHIAVTVANVSVPAHPSRRRAVRGDHLRNHDRLLAAAIELFDEEGLDVPLNKIAARAGVSQAGIFRHFPNRRQLLIETYDYAATRLTSAVLEALNDSLREPVDIRLDRFLLAIVTHVSAHPGYGELTTHGMRLDPERPVHAELMEKVESLVHDAQGAGLLADDVTGFDLMLTTVLAAGMIAGPEAVAGMGRRALCLLRRGYAPQAQGIATMPSGEPWAAIRDVPSD